MHTRNHTGQEGIKMQNGLSPEQNLKGKRLIIEFVGPTGSGKTTNCFHFTNHFRKEDLRVFVFKDIKIWLYQLAIHQRFSLYLDSLVSNRSNILSYFRLLASNGIYSIGSIYRYVKLCIFNTALQRFINIREFDILFLDQWIIQGLWSATIFKVKHYDNLQKEIGRFFFKTHLVLYFDIDEQTASERIAVRDSGRSRFDQMKKEKILEALGRYNQYLIRLYENSDCRFKMSFSTKVTPEENAGIFYRRLMDLITQNSFA